MKKNIKLNHTYILFLFLSFSAVSLSAQNYESYFTEERLRAEIIFAGNSESQNIYLESFHREPLWSGNRKKLTAPFTYGEYNYRLENLEGDTLFISGFNSLFQEWRTTPEAGQINKAFRGSCITPYPKQKMNLIISERLRDDGSYKDIATFAVDPSDPNTEPSGTHSYTIDTILYNGSPQSKADITFLAEGYTAKEMDKFKNDVLTFTEHLFTIEPFKSNRDKFNIWSVNTPSKEKGTDIPHKGVWKNSIASTSFNTFYIDRYLTAQDQSILSELAAGTPYDAIYVIVNTPVYGGGGIYNFYGLSMSDHHLSEEVFIHELGHSFAGLADEYYTSEVAYENFYNLSIEPWEPNITTLVDFRSKWAALEEAGKAGLHEGGGYMAKGIFRSAPTCIMKTTSAQEFCPACRGAILKMIKYYSE
jgi:hypothetical protein